MTFGSVVRELRKLFAGKGTEQLKPAESLTVADLRVTPVWKFENRDDLGETMVRPVKEYPLRSSHGALIGTQVVLANGKRIWALMGSVDHLDPRQNEHFLTLSIDRNDQWFHLARYHDFDYAERGPAALAQFLEMSVDQVFPISFDVTQYFDGNSAALRGSVQKEPREKLTNAELTALAVP